MRSAEDQQRIFRGLVLEQQVQKRVALIELDGEQQIRMAVFPRSSTNELGSRASVDQSSRRFSSAGKRY
ncbi:MAG: hypothetical protein R3F14_42425 [Polyangiaceae bacterium]